MTDTPIAILQKAADLGLTLSFTPPDTLDVKASGPWPKSFAETVRTDKAQLLGLLQLPFVMVDSEILDETIFFCADDDTRTALIEAGADQFSIYTRDELRVLVEQNRVAPLSATELRKVHEIKRTFSGSITRP
jgi:hypothetical protein